jgi:hypothetical protein
MSESGYENQVSTVVAQPVAQPFLIPQLPAPLLEMPSHAIAVRCSYDPATREAKLHRRIRGPRAAIGELDSQSIEHHGTKVIVA